MKKPLRYISIFIVLICLLIVNQGCSSYSDLSISKEEFKMVNKYIKELGLEEISLEDAISIEGFHLYENKETKEKKQLWQLAVDYIQNEKSDNPVNLNYKVTFASNGVGFESNGECD